MSSTENATPKQFSIPHDFTFESWEDETLDLKSQLLRGLYAFGFDTPSPIQKKAVGPMISKDGEGKRKDIIAQAQSGTGKTGAFSVGVLEIVDAKKDFTQALILAPTHELANQIKQVISSLGNFLKIKIQLLVGGTSVDEDKKKLENDKPQIVVGTPGRVHDMIRRKFLQTDKISVLVLDEADEMLSYGFKDQMYKIFQLMPNNIQVGLFSATLPPELEQLTSKFMRNPYKIMVKAEQLTLQGIAQYFVSVDDDEQKYAVLKDLFETLTLSMTIIYCNSTRRVDELTEALSEDAFPVKKIHGKMDAKERKENHQDFRCGSTRVLVTSDLFARGIDIQQVSIVINFDIPKCQHTYLHRIGRSGRWGRKGVAINFLTKYDGARLRHFEEYYDTKITEMPLDYQQHLGL
jgi:translation initiation factor 4A